MRQNLSEWGSFYWVVPIVVISLILIIWLKRKPWGRPVLWSMLLVWIAGAVYLMFLYRLPPRRGMMNLDIFHMFRRAMDFKGSVAENQALRQILFNVLLYVPLGAILGALTGKSWITLLIGFGLSVISELLQYWLKLGTADIDDVISNTIGLIAGVFLYKGLVLKWHRRSKI